MSTLQISYSRNGEKHEIQTGNAALGNIVIDNSVIPAEERNGTAKQLLGSAALYCYCAALNTAMEARGLEYKDMQAVATLTADFNANQQSRIVNIDIAVSVSIDEDDADLFERIQKVMRNGCLVTNSLHEGIAMNYKLMAEFDK